ncbi:metallophosphoesterase family protein [Halopiger aswanensis]|uniref:DNA repair exonuclease SbcCD nuclease subunit n=1 Tax=Halopiger aswanensis TaxID=148449 RepID=A0A419WJJ0_9EURY|nr:metallophosphoesterase [Halopiger aswanensis]RKD95644.1 DNA repair exonuclease SbcCD nuclease subunit [Halopiger aswanensis]
MSKSNNTRFLHFSDAHIGHRQYNLKKRRDDMNLTYNWVIHQAIEHDVDFTVFGGDLFHNKNVNALALSDAERGLEKLREEDIPVVGIRGNHDAKLYKEDLHWLEYLHTKENLVLLNADLDGDGPVFEEHDPENPGTSSGYIEINGVRIFGLQYLGQQTGRYLETVAEGIRQVNEEKGEPDTTVLLGHFGIEGHIPGMSGGISYNQLEPVEELVDYLGLGHLHKQYSHGDWIFNPGSPEAHNTRQARWDLGYYLVDVEPDGSFEAEHRLSKRRPFYRIDFEVDQYDTPEELEQGFKQKVMDEIPGLQQVQQKDRYTNQGQPRNPVIDLHLEGLLNFNRSQLDIERIREIVEQKTDALHVSLKDATESREAISVIQDLEEGEEEIQNEDGQIDRDKLEHAVFQQLAGQDSRYETDVEGVAETLSSVKNSLLAGDSPESVAETVKERRRELFPETGGDNE